jgi:Phage tail lysozyme
VGSAPNEHRKTRKLRRTGKHCAPLRAQPTARRLGLIAPAIIAIGAVAAWQFNPLDADAAPASAQTTAAFHRDAAAADRAAASLGRLNALGAMKLEATTSRHPQQAHPASTPSPAGRSRAAASTRKPAPAKVTTFTCSGTSASASTSGLLPANYAAIVDYLTAHGYAPLAAAGIAGNIYQESKGDPESVGTGGGGLIGWTPLPAGFVTGNPAADLQTQLAALLTYNQQWSQFIPVLNAATNPTEAADIYMNYFERPGIPAAYNREGAAVAVAEACGMA